MSIDQSLKITNSLAQHRNVLSRAERIERLRERNRFDPEKQSPLGLPKVGNRKVEAGKKSKKKTEEE